MYQVGQNPLKDVDPRVFTRIVTDGSVTISPRNFVGEGIMNADLSKEFLQSVSHSILQSLL
jgi:hypothetical protein